jgi:hypothetical protein
LREELQRGVGYWRVYLNAGSFTGEVELLWPSMERALELFVCYIGDIVYHVAKSKNRLEPVLLQSDN